MNQNMFRSVHKDLFLKNRFKSCSSSSLLGNNKFAILQGRPGRQGPQGASGEKGSRVSQHVQKRKIIGVKRNEILYAQRCTR